MPRIEYMPEFESTEHITDIYLALVDKFWVMTYICIKPSIWERAFVFMFNYTGIHASIHIYFFLVHRFLMGYLSPYLVADLSCRLPWGNIEYIIWYTSSDSRDQTSLQNRIYLRMNIPNHSGLLLIYSMLTVGILPVHCKLSLYGFDGVLFEHFPFDRTRTFGI